MDDVSKYGVKADRVISDLKDAVGVADDRLVHLQKELDFLAEKAKEESYIWRRKFKSSSTSDIENEDVSRYLEDCSRSTQESHSRSSSLHSSSSMLNENASTKPFVTHEEQQRNLTNSYRAQDDFYNIDGPQLTNGITTIHSRRSDRNDRKKQEGPRRTESLSASDTYEYMSREELVKKLSELSAKKRSTPKDRGQYAKIKSMTQEDESIENDFVCASLRPAKRSNKQSGKHTKEDAFLYLDSDDKGSERHFKPICPEILTSRSDGGTGDVTKKVSDFREVIKLEDELELERNKNKKLKDEFASLEEDYKELEMKYELKNQEKKTGKVVGMVDKIQHAQKLRENAMLQRLQIAAQDRDEALMRAKAIHAKNVHLERMSKSGICENGDKTLMEVVDRITTADSARVIEKYGNELLKRMHNLRNARKRITSEEMSAVIRERDDAIAKCHSLQQELQNCMDELSELKKSKDTTVNVSLKAKVRSTQQESAKTQEKLHTAEEEIQMLRIYYSLHKSLTLAQDKDLAEKYNQYMTNIREEATKRVQQAKQVEAENQQLRDELHLIEQQKNTTENSNQLLQEELRHAREKCAKLERLVKVLRRKLIGHSQLQSV